MNIYNKFINNVKHINIYREFRNTNMHAVYICVCVYIYISDEELLVLELEKQTNFQIRNPLLVLLELRINHHLSDLV